MKLLIAIPSMDTLPVFFVQSLLALNKPEDTLIQFITNSLIYESRNRLCTIAINGGFDKVLWLDSDMKFDPDTLDRLIADDRAIVSGLYFKRVPPYSPVAFRRLDIVERDCIFERLKVFPADGLFEVAGVGFGCVLMDVSVLRAIYDKVGPLWFAPIGNIGEDCAFCIRARELGYHVWVDPTIKLGHIGQMVFTEKDYNG